MLTTSSAKSSAQLPMKSRRQFGPNFLLKTLLGLAALGLGASAWADPPTRVARLGYIQGAVSFSPAGDDVWVEAGLNRPLISGDRLWVDAGARDELQVGSGAIRMGGSTSVTLLNLDDHVVQLQLTQGTLNVHVRFLGADDVFEIDTPNLAFSVRQPGDYRLVVDADGNATQVTVRSGQADVSGEGVSYVIDDGQNYLFTGTSLNDYQLSSVPPADEFDRWSFQREYRFANSASSDYVARDMIGYEDLDGHGDWHVVEGYGNVWTPSHVAADWAPYRDGHWSWVEPWGWTWVDDASWGFAVSHYGRWTNLSGRWGWVPGPAAVRSVYAPALVAFVGVSNFHLGQFSRGGVAWFPLGPRDVYRPNYRVSQHYFTNINVSNTTVNRVNITKIYNTTVVNNTVNVTNITYANRNVPGAMIAVPASTFVQSQPVGKAMVPVPRNLIGTAPVTPGAALPPVRVSLTGLGHPGGRPAPQVLTRPVLAKTVPPAPPVSFANRQTALTANAGLPLDAATLAKMRLAAPVNVPQITVLHPAGGSHDRRVEPVPVGPVAPATHGVPGATPVPGRPVGGQLPPAPPIGQQPDRRPPFDSGRAHGTTAPAPAPTPAVPNPAGNATVPGITNGPGNRVAVPPATPIITPATPVGPVTPITPVPPRHPVTAPDAVRPEARPPVTRPPLPPPNTPEPVRRHGAEPASGQHPGADPVLPQPPQQPPQQPQARPQPAPQPQVVPPPQREPHPAQPPAPAARPPAPVQAPAVAPTERRNPEVRPSEHNVPRPEGVKNEEQLKAEAKIRRDEQQRREEEDKKPRR